MAEYRYYLIPDFMSHVFPQQFEEQAPTEFFSNTADLMKRYKQLREMPYNNEYTWNERTNLPYPRLTVGIDRRDPDGAVTVMQVRNGVNYLCDDYRGPFADRNDKQLIEMAKQLVTAVGVDRIRPHYYTEENGHTKVHVGKDIHITEWANAPELCSALRFSRFLNRDGQQLFQVRNGQRIIENYADGSQLVKDVQTVDDTHRMASQTKLIVPTVCWNAMWQTVRCSGRSLTSRCSSCRHWLCRVLSTWHGCESGCRCRTRIIRHFKVSASSIPVRFHCVWAAMYRPTQNRC